MVWAEFVTTSIISDYIKELKCGSHYVKKDNTVEPLYKDTPEVRTSPLTRTLCLFPCQLHREVSKTIYVTCYEKKDYLGTMVVQNIINFYHDNVQLTFYKCSCEYTCISVHSHKHRVDYTTVHYMVHTTCYTLQAESPKWSIFS